MRIKNKKMLYGLLSVFLLLSTILPCYTLLTLNTTGAKAVSEDIIDFDYIESLLKYNSSEDSSEYQDVVNAINFLESNYGEIIGAKDQNMQLKTSGATLNLNLDLNLGITKAEIPWWFKLLCNNPLLGIIVLMGMGLIIGIREVAKSLFAKAFPGVTEMLVALNEFMEMIDNLEENLGNAIDNALENVVEGFIEATIEGIEESLNYEPPKLYEIREIVSHQLRLIDSRTDWQNVKSDFVNNYITGSNPSSFKFKNLAGNLIYLCAMEYWVDNKNYAEPKWADPKTWSHPYCGDTWYCYADYALYYNLEKPNNHWIGKAGIPEIMFSEDYRIGIDFNSNEKMDYGLNNQVIAQVFRSHTDKALMNAQVQIRNNLARGYPTGSSDIRYMVEETIVDMMSDSIEDYNKIADEISETASNIADTITSSPIQGVSSKQFYLGVGCETVCQYYNVPDCPCGIQTLVYKYQEEKYGYSSKDIQNEANKAARKEVGDVLRSGYKKFVESLGKVVEITQFGSFSHYISGNYNDDNNDIYDDWGDDIYDMDGDGQWDADPGFYGYEDDYSDSGSDGCPGDNDGDGNADFGGDSGNYGAPY
jgi:hypothetical protein